MSAIRSGSCSEIPPPPEERDVHTPVGEPKVRFSQRNLCMRPLFVRDK